MFTPTKNAPFQLATDTIMYKPGKGSGNGDMDDIANTLGPKSRKVLFSRGTTVTWNGVRSGGLLVVIVKLPHGGSIGWYGVNEKDLEPPVRSLRSSIIRLAHANPKLRGDLLPLLKEAAVRKTMTREQIEGMGAAEINKFLDALDKESSAITDEFIAAGRGSERPSETLKMTDPLALRYIQNWKDADLLRDEVSRRYGPGAPRRLPRGFGPIKVAAPRAVLSRANVVKFLVTELKKLPGVKVKSSKNSIILVPGALNPMVKGIEITNLDLDNAPFRMTLTNGMVGWGWDAYRKPAPVFHDAHNTLKLGVVFDGKRDPAVELRAFIANVLLVGIGKAGNVWDGKKLIPMGGTPVPPAPAAVAPKAPPAAPPVAPTPKVSLDDIKSMLRSIKLGPAGRVSTITRDGTTWDIEPTNRQRLDHYVGSHYDPDEDEDSEGWDSDGWEEEYVGPTVGAAQKWLKEEFGPGLFEVDVDEKGFVLITLTVEGRKKFLA